MTTTRITVDGEPVAFEFDEVEPFSIPTLFAWLKIGNPEHFDLVHVTGPGRSEHIGGETFTPVDGGEYVTARKSTTVA